MGFFSKKHNNDSQTGLEAEATVELKEDGSPRFKIKMMSNHEFINGQKVKMTIIPIEPSSEDLQEARLNKIEQEMLILMEDMKFMRHSIVNKDIKTETKILSKPTLNRETTEIKEVMEELEATQPEPIIETQEANIAKLRKRGRPKKINEIMIDASKVEIPIADLPPHSNEEVKLQ